MRYGQIFQTDRDRLYGKVFGTGYGDTADVVNSDDIMEDEINKQVRIAIDESDVIYVVDVMNGLTSLEIGRSVTQESGKPV